MKTPAMPWVDEDDEDAISERAAEIFAKRRWGAWSEADQSALDAWLRESVLHEVAWLRVAAIAERTDGLARLNALAPKETAPQTSQFRHRRFLLPLLMAASIALILPFAVPYATGLLQPPDRTYSTEVGGRTTLKFADGTVVDLNTDTTVRFRMTTRERAVWLEKGEAWFHVAHDAAHPFTVFAGRHRVTDLGTEFLVRRSAGTMEVALLSGKASLGADGAPLTMLSPGDDAVATPVSMSITRKTPQELADELAWRHGMLVFRNTRLADAVSEINRYTATKLVILDPAIADLRFNGEIRNDNLADFLETAQDMMKLRVDRRGNDIFLSRDSREQAKRAAHTRGHAGTP